MWHGFSRISAENVEMKKDDKVGFAFQVCRSQWKQGLATRAVASKQSSAIELK
ncbi:hypothetical protein [Thermoflavimicrobium daqui]|uniref:hypothetical protein n=1 Tax=Thermoflavimicrobium daqui TaxID=2137476 RepID=UPI00143DEB12|nr:hypothetical protein [Thermoflavimicrobium daqui]